MAIERVTDFNDFDSVVLPVNDSDVWASTVGLEQRGCIWNKGTVLQNNIFNYVTQLRGRILCPNFIIQYIYHSVVSLRVHTTEFGTSIHNVGNSF